MRIIIVGAGGTGLSGIATMLHRLGYTGIVCIDVSESQLTKELRSHWLRTIIGHGTMSINPDDVVIYSAACINTPEVQQSLSYLNDPTVSKHYSFSYFQFLGIVSQYFRTLAFTGTNGKSSSTSLALYTASQALQTPVALGILGALVPQLDNNNHRLNPTLMDDIRAIWDTILSGRPLKNPGLIKKYRFIVEACEFRRHFLHIDPEITAITNIDFDHSDYFKDPQDYKNAFTELIKKTKTPALYPHNHTHPTQDRTIYQLPHLIGQHRQDNASIVDQALTRIGIKKDDISQGLASFTGLRRRLEKLSQHTNGSILYTDYGHHAPALTAVYQALRQHYPDHHIVAYFQPHQAKRVLQGRNDFATILKQFDQTLIYSLYTARESLSQLQQEFKHFDFAGIETFDDLWEIFARTCAWSYHTHINDIISHRTTIKPNTIAVIFSAGDLDRDIRQALA